MWGYSSWFNRWNLADDTNKILDSCDQLSENCTCFPSTNGSMECGCSLGYELNDEGICEGEKATKLSYGS